MNIFNKLTVSLIIAGSIFCPNLLDPHAAEPSASQAYYSNAEKTKHYRTIYNSNEFKTILKKDLEQTISKEIEDKFTNFERIKCLAEANNVKLNFDAAIFIEKTEDTLADIENLIRKLPCPKGKRAPLSDDELHQYFEELKIVYNVFLDTRAAFAELIFDLVKNVPVEADFIIEINKTLKNELALFFKVNQSSKIIFNEHYPNHEKIMENFLEFRNAFFNKSSESIEKDCYVPFLKEKQKEIDKMINATIDKFKDEARRTADIAARIAAEEQAARENAARIAADKKAADETAARIALEKKNEADRIHKNTSYSRAKKMALCAVAGTAVLAGGAIGCVAYGALCAYGSTTGTIMAAATIQTASWITTPAVVLAGGAGTTLSVGSASLAVGGVATGAVLGIGSELVIANELVNDKNTNATTVDQTK